MKKIFLGMLFLVIIYSCNNAKNENTKAEVFAAPKEEKELVVKISFKTSKEDIFKITLNNIVVDELQKKSIQIYETVPPSSSFENIIAKFGVNNISNSIIFNLGNKEQKEIELNNIELSYGVNTIQITTSNFNKYLRYNQFIDFNEDTFSLKTKRDKGKHNPVIFARKTLIDFLKKEAK
jgi:hypothetical protein